MSIFEENRMRFEFIDYYLLKMSFKILNRNPKTVFLNFWRHFHSDFRMMIPIHALWSPFAFPGGNIILRLLNLKHNLWIYFTIGLHSHCFENSEIWIAFKSCCDDGIFPKKLHSIVIVVTG
jgi:hypothetical protein